MQLDLRESWVSSLSLAWSFLVLAPHLLRHTFQPQINLGTNANYVLLSHTAITNGATTIISGAGSRVVGISPGISDVGTVSSIIASGATEFQNGTGEPTLAQSDLQNAIASVSSLTPKVVSANLSLADSATGDSNAIFVFVAPTALNTSAAITVFLQNDAQAANIYWVVGAALTLGASTNISGNFLVTAGTTIGASSTLYDRILSQDAVTLGASVVLVS